jgi:hypothetical protein
MMFLFNNTNKAMGQKAGYLKVWEYREYNNKYPVTGSVFYG